VSNLPDQCCPLQAAGVIFRYHTTTFVGEQTRLTFPEMRGRYVRLSVYNGDDQPLQIKDVKLFAIPRQIIFEWTPGRPLRLFYGADAARPPQYDLSTYLGYEKVQPRTGLALGPQQQNRDYPWRKVPWTERQPWLIYLALLLAVLVVGGLLMRTMAKVGTSDKQGSSEETGQDQEQD
jgi:hypothetical protein